MSVIYPDLIKDSRWNETFNANGQLLQAQVERSFYVGQITDNGAIPASDRVQGLAKNAIQAIVPAGAPHPQRPEATARNYRVEPWQDNQGAQVIVSFVYDGFGGVETQYTLEMTGGLRQVPTDSEFDENGNLIPITVDYIRDWAAINLPTPDIFTFLHASVTDLPVLRPLGSLTLTKTITAAQAATLELVRDNYLGYTNMSVFRGKAINTMLCSEIATIAQPFQAQYLARVRWDYLPETWDGWARFRNDQLGIPANLWRDWSATYTSQDTDNSNGIKRCKTYLRSDMNALFSTVTVVTPPI